MKLLILTNNPERSSFRQRIEVYLEAMAEKGIETAVEAVPRGLPGRWKVYAKARDVDGVLLHKKGLHMLDARLLRKWARTLIFTYDDASNGRISLRLLRLFPKATAYAFEPNLFYRETLTHKAEADSHAPETVHQVQSIFGPEPADFAFIDGDHTYEGVKSVFQLYGPLVRTGGIIAFHDIFSRPDSPDIQVDRFWNEIKMSYSTDETVAPPETGRQIGIGIIHVT